MKISWLLLNMVLIICILFMQTANAASDDVCLTDEGKFKVFISENLKKNRTMEGLLADMLVNGGGNTKVEVLKKPGSAIYFFYYAQEALHKYEIKKSGSLDNVLDAIETALRKDDNALNYFFKSYVLYKCGKTKESDEVFLMGTNAKEYSTYLSEGSNAFVKILISNNRSNPINAFALLNGVNKIGIDNEFLLYCAKKIKKLMKDRTYPLAQKKKLYCGLNELLRDSKGAFYYLQYNLVYINDLIIKQAPASVVTEKCIFKYDKMILKDPDDLVSSYHKFTETGNIEYLRGSIYWKNFVEITRNLNRMQ